MMCPKCKAKIGIMHHEVTVDTGMVVVVRCIICGYWLTPTSDRQSWRPVARATA